jgi:excisionase family DNA binding protein
MKRRGYSQAALSTMQVAERCGVHYTTVRRWILDGNLPAYETPGGHLRVLETDVHAFLESRKLRGGRSVSGPLRVLIVDDDLTFLKSAAEFLGRQPNVSVRQAADGFAAGRQVSEFQPHVVILDRSMAGMDGLEVCRNIKASPRSRNMRLLVLTGYATADDIEKAKESGADLCMAKPARLDELRDAVLRLARGPSQGERKLEPGTSSEP